MYLQVEGTLIIEGTAERPVTLSPSELFDDRAVVLNNKGSISVAYATIWNLLHEMQIGFSIHMSL